ncbi:MAG: 3-oxoacyl-ACP reductase FabG [Syntrophus sp. (in: bacteria)]|nr:3-oxoacyl-ACP reductase FabG [Syntrophus sp. (in: bacteria)]
MNKGKIALITGASKGIGAAIAVTLARDGFDIWLNYRSDHEGASVVAREVEEMGRKCILLPFDVSDGEAVRSSLMPLLEEETPYALVNNAGYRKDTIMAMMNEEEWKGVLSVTLDGFFLISKLLLMNMLRKREGRIINIVSTSGQSGLAGQVNYSAAKAGLIGATKALAAEIAKRNILVNAVSPGFIDTEMTKDLPKEMITPSIPLGRFGKAMEVAEVVSFLVSDKASYITGQVIAVNGGVYM